MGHNYITWPILILGAPSISQEWLKLELLNFVRREIISSIAKGMTNHPWKRSGLAHVTHFACATVDLKILPHNAVNWDQQCRLLFLAIGWSMLQSLRLKLHQFDLSLYLLQTRLYSISTTNRLSGVWALSFKYVLITDIFSVCSNLLSTNAHCLVIILSEQSDTVDFAWSSLAQSIGISRCTF